MNFVEFSISEIINYILFFCLASFNQRNYFGIINIVVFPVWGYYTRAAINIFVQVLYGHTLSLLLSKYLGVERLGHMVDICLTSKETAKLLSKMVMPCHILPAGYERSISSTSSPTLGMISLFELRRSNCNGCVVAFHCGF